MPENGNVMTPKPFQEEFLRFRDKLKSYLFRLTANLQDAEDLTQDTYLKAEKNLSGFSGKSSLKTWAFTIATNLAKDHFRARQRWPVDIQDRCKKSTQANPQKVAAMEKIVETSAAEKYDFREHIDYCFTCIAKSLEIEQQLVIILKDVYGFKISEIMKILSLSEGQVKYALTEARKIMISIFDRRCVLVSKKGVCYQCSEINGFINPRQDERENLLKIKMVNDANNGASKMHLYQLRAELVKNIDPLNVPGFPLHTYLLQLMPENLE